MFTCSSRDLSIFVYAQAAAGSAVAQAQTSICGQLVSSIPAVGDTIEEAVEGAIFELVPSVPARGSLTLEEWVELASLELSTYTLN